MGKKKKEKAKTGNSWQAAAESVCAKNVVKAMTTITIALR